MKIKLSKKIPGFTMESAMIFSHTTRLADLYTPSPEQIYLPEKFFPDVDVNIEVQTENTGPQMTGSQRWKFAKRLASLVKGDSTIDRQGQFIFDARFDTDKNPSHVIDNICLPILYAQQVISEHLDQDVKIQVILTETPSSLARQMYETLDIPVICTDSDVYGNVVKISTNQLFNVIPQVFNMEFKGYRSNTPERVFIPRRGNRAIINNDEVTNFLESQGFVTYYFEDLTPSEEWSIARNAKVVVAVHGASGAHMNFNRLGLESPNVSGSGLSLIEIFSPTFVLTARRHLAAVLNGKWCGVRGQITPRAIHSLDFKVWDNSLSPLKSPVKDPFRLDIKTIQMALEHLNIKPI
jgi:hypothetical protein